MTRWYALLAMLMVYTLSIADRYVISTVLEPIRLELQLSDAGIAFLSGVSLALFYVVLGFPLGWLLDRVNRIYLIALCVIGWSVMTVLGGLSQTYTQLLWSRIGVGIGEAGGTPGANSLLSDFFPAARRPMALTVFSLGAPLGAWLGASLAGGIADQHGWRAAFLVLGAPGIVFGLVLLLSVREPPRGRWDRDAMQVNPSLIATARFLWQQRAAVHILAAGALTALWGWGLMWWTPVFLMRMYHLSVGQAGAILGPIHLVGGIGATLLTAWWLSRPSMSDPRRVVRLLGVGIGAATLASFGVFWTHSLAVAQVLLWIFVPAIYFYIGPGFGVLNNLAPPRMRALFCAALLFLANIGNLIIAPEAVGWLSDLAASNLNAANSLRLALLCLVPTGLWASGHFFLSARTILADQARVVVTTRSMNGL